MSGVRTHTISRTGFLSDPRPPARHRVAAVFSIEKSPPGRIALRKRGIMSLFQPAAAKESHKAGFFLNCSAKTGSLRVLAVFSSIGVNFILMRRRLSYEHRELRTRRSKQNTAPTMKDVAKEAGVSPPDAPGCGWCGPGRRWPG